MEFIKNGVVIKSSATRSITKKALDRPSSTRSSSTSSSTKSSKKNCVPPPAPRPPRLATPDLPDLECGDFCDCCKSNTSAMDRQLAAAKLYISESRSRVALEPQYERKKPRALRLDAGKSKRA